MPRRIAIVEDDAAIRANYADALRKHGYEVSAHAARGADPGERAPVKMEAVREDAWAADTRAKAIELALTHHLVTKYASLIAIERAPARSALAPAPRPRPEKID